jgi:hypothetical protein
MGLILEFCVREAMAVSYGMSGAIIVSAFAAIGASVGTFVIGSG